MLRIVPHTIPRVGRAYERLLKAARGTISAGVSVDAFRAHEGLYEGAPIACPINHY